MKIYLSFLLLCAINLWAIDDYKRAPETERREGVPVGTVTKHQWTSKIFPGTVRDYWVYVPRQYKSEEPACLMIFQDGGGYADTNGAWRVPVVFDNLIHSKEMPVTIGLFINPGILPAASTNQHPRYNRSFEYDSIGDQYARFLIEEMIPELSKSYNITTNAAGRAIGGASSGAICAFTAAWERPDQFSKVFSTIGTYVSLRGGHNYAPWIRKTEPKPIRIFLQDGTNDLNIYGGNWFIANEDMASALQFAGYDHKTVWGDGAHNSKHGSAILPDALRWLWRDYPSGVVRPVATRQPVMQILQPGEDWALVAEGYRFTEGPAADNQGNLFFTDIPNNRIHKIDIQGNVTVFAENTGGANGLMFGPDGKLYACQNRKRRIVAYDRDAKETSIVEDVESNDLVVNHKGEIYFTDPQNKKVWFVDKQRNKKVVDTGINRPNGIILTPDQSQLIVADTSGPHLWIFRIEEDGSLSYKQPYFTMDYAPGKTDSGADGMTMDIEGRVYVTTHMGLQFFDQAGRLNGIILKPQPKWLSNVTFGGPDLDTLYVTCGDKVYKRKTKTKGVDFSKGPRMPPRVRL